MMQMHQRARAVGLALLLAAGSANAEVPSLSDAQRRQVMEQLQKTRTLYRAGDYPRAMEAARAALDVDPDNAAALSELSLAAFKARQWAAAEEAALEALRGATGWERGAAFYNLGRVREERGDRARAIFDYVQSLRARPSSTVRQRLAGLDAVAAAATEPLAVRPMLGPYPSLAKLCDALHKLPRDGEEERWQCDPAAPSPRAPASTAGASSAPWMAPWKEVRLLETRSISDVEHDVGARTFHLVVEVEGAASRGRGKRSSSSWFVAERIASACGARRCEGTLEVQELQARDLGAPALLLRLRDREDVRGDLDDAESWTIAGLGPSGLPSLVAPFAVRVHAQKRLWDELDGKGQPKTATIDMELSATWSPPGQRPAWIELKGSGRGAAELVGRHTLTFP